MGGWMRCLGCDKGGGGGDVWWLCGMRREWWRFHGEFGLCCDGGGFGVEVGGVWDGVLSFFLVCLLALFP